MSLRISDGVGIPHAANYSDLLDIVVAFGVANGWTLTEDQRADASAHVILRGAGTTGTDAIYVGLQKYADASNDNYGWRLKGYTGYNAGAAWGLHPGALAANPCVPLWNNSIPYWLMVNSRRILLVCKVGATYQGFYLGYGLQFATPNQYPYPLVIGGSAVYEQKYNLQSSYNSFFTHPFLGDSTNNNLSALHVRLPDGTWYSPAFARTGNLENPNGRLRGTYPFAEIFAGSGYSGNVNMHLCREALDGTYVVEPVYVLRAEGAPLVQDFLLELEGVKWVSAFQNSAENKVVEGAREFLCVPNVYRSSDSQMFAVELA